MSTKVKAELLLASKNKHNGVVLYSWRLTFPRIILSEINTHRVASRNTSSSRAIPSKKMRAAVLNDPFIPISLGRNQKGMQAGTEIEGWRRKVLLLVLSLGRYPAVFMAWLLEALGAHKQVANRFLEPWSWCTQIFSATDVGNLFKLRCHPDAEPHFQKLAIQMQAQVEYAEKWFKWAESKQECEHYPGCGFELNVQKLQILGKGEWHLPLVRQSEQLTLAERKRVSAARCARTSYTLLDTGKESSIENDIALCDRLIEAGHMSPTEHQAAALWNAAYRGNFKGWEQYRKEIEVASE